MLEIETIKRTTLEKHVHISKIMRVLSRHIFA